EREAGLCAAPTARNDYSRCGVGSVALRLHDLRGPSSSCLSVVESGASPGCLVFECELLPNPYECRLDVWRRALEVGEQVVPEFGERRVESPIRCGTFH